MLDMLELASATYQHVQKLHETDGESIVALVLLYYNIYLHGMKIIHNYQPSYEYELLDQIHHDEFLYTFLLNLQYLAHDIHNEHHQNELNLKQLQLDLKQNMLLLHNLMLVI